MPQFAIRVWPRKLPKNQILERLWENELVGI